MDLIYESGILLVLGLAIGVLSGLFGIGGGFIRIPAFIALFPLIGVPTHQLMHFAVGTSVALIIPTAVASSLKQYRQGNLDLGFYWEWAVAISIGVLLGLVLVPYTSTRDFKIFFLLLVVIVTVYLALVPDSLTISDQPPHGAGKAMMAIVIGMISALTGTAGGMMITPALKMCCVPLKRAIATASASGLVIGVISTAGFIYHGWNYSVATRYAFGYVNLLVFLAMAPGVFVGSWAGARLNNHLTDKLIKRLYIALLIVVAGDVGYGLAG